jgi:hypothetical protein
MKHIPQGEPRHCGRRVEVQRTRPLEMHTPRGEAIGLPMAPGPGMYLA